MNVNHTASPPLLSVNGQNAVMVVVDPTRRLAPLLRSRRELDRVAIVDVPADERYPSAEQVLAHGDERRATAVVIDLSASPSDVWDLVVSIRSRLRGQDLPILLTTQKRWRHGLLALSLSAIEVTATGDGIGALLERLAGVLRI